MLSLRRRYSAAGPADGASDPSSCEAIAACDPGHCLPGSSERSRRSSHSQSLYWSTCNTSFPAVVHGTRKRKNIRYDITVILVVMILI